MGYIPIFMVACSSIKAKSGIVGEELFNSLGFSQLFPRFPWVVYLSLGFFTSFTLFRGLRAFYLGDFLGPRGWGGIFLGFFGPPVPFVLGKCQYSNCKLPPLGASNSPIVWGTPKKGLATKGGRIGGPIPFLYHTHGL